jgi:hypothetical protein
VIIAESGWIRFTWLHVRVLPAPFAVALVVGFPALPGQWLRATGGIVLAGLAAQPDDLALPSIGLHDGDGDPLANVAGLNHSGLVWA